MNYFSRVVLLCALIFVPATSFAQQKDTTSIKPVHTSGISGADNSATGDPPSTDQMRPDEQMGTSGFFLGMVSVLAGATIGSQIGQANCPSSDVDRDCTSRHAYTGAMIAGTLMVPLGVRLVASHPKNFLESIGVSALIGSSLYFGSRAIPGKPIALGTFLAIPLQVYSSVKLQNK